MVPSFKGIFGSFPKQECPPGATAPDCSQYWERQIAQEWNPASASCSHPGTEPTSSTGDPPLGRASVSCPEDPEEFEQVLTADAFGEVGGPQLSGGGYSKITMYRDPERGLISRVESVARGITLGIPGSVTLSASISEIRSVAESWSNGRPGKDGVSRSSRTVTISGFVGPGGTRCDQCDPQAVIDALNTAFVGRAYFRQGLHDERLYDGSEGGAQTAVQKSDAQRESDNTLTGDARSEVPALEMIIYNDTPPWGRGRQIYQFAGVKTASTYNISCVFDETEEGTCAGPPPLLPASLNIKLTDEEEQPLAGGVFAIHVDTEADGVLDSLVDPLLSLNEEEGATCTTTEDGVGDCTFEKLDPGAYVIHQVTAPEGYAPTKDFPVAVEEGLVYDITFTNLKAAGGIEITLTDDSPEAKPLSGGAFEVFADNGNETLDPTDVKVGACTTGADGTCGFDDVPLGLYLVKQTGAPPEYLLVEEALALNLELPGQMARLTIRNGQTGIDAIPPSVSSSPPLPPVEVAEVVIEEPPPPSPSEVSVSPAPAPLRALPRIVGRVAEGIRLLLSSPRDAALMATVWLLFLSPVLVGGRRRLLRRISIQA